MQSIFRGLADGWLLGNGPRLHGPAISSVQILDELLTEMQAIHHEGTVWSPA
jgi:hypothetical protein